MVGSRTLTLFAAPGAAGEQLAARILGLGTELGCDCRIERDVTVRTGLRAQFCDDVVVYDLTTDGRTEGGYRALVSPYSNLDHVLLVSRTPLPFNILPARSGGAPPYPYPLTRLPDGVDVVYSPRTAVGEGPWEGENDASLLRWLRRQLEDLAAHPVGPRLPRPPSFELMWPYSADVVRFVKNLPGILAFKRMYQGQAFVSYRGSRAADVLRLSRSLAGTSPSNLHVVAPGELALERELLSANRRWMVLSQLRMFIFSASELWVYESDDYLRSWWTLAELVLAQVAASKLAEGISPSAPRIRTYDPATGQLRDGPPTAIRVWKHQRTLIERMSGLVQPGLSWPPFYGPGSDPTPRLPMRVGRRKEWTAFSDTLMIDRRVLEPSAEPYRTSATALLKGLREMVHLDTASLAAAAASGRPVHTPDGQVLTITELPPRLAFSVPRSTDPTNPVLHVLPTYYALS